MPTHDQQSLAEVGRASPGLATPTQLWVVAQVVTHEMCSHVYVLLPISSLFSHLEQLIPSPWHHIHLPQEVLLKRGSRAKCGAEQGHATSTLFDARGTVQLVCAVGPDQVGSG